MVEHIIEVCVFGIAPMKTNAELPRRLDFTKKIKIAQAKATVEKAGKDSCCRFTNADHGNLRRVDEYHLARGKRPFNRHRRHQAGGTGANDHKLLNAIFQAVDPQVSGRFSKIIVVTQVGPLGLTFLGKHVFQTIQHFYDILAVIAGTKTETNDAMSRSSQGQMSLRSALKTARDDHADIGKLTRDFD